MILIRFVQYNVRTFVIQMVKIQYYTFARMMYYAIQYRIGSLAVLFNFVKLEPNITHTVFTLYELIMVKMLRMHTIYAT